MSKYSMDLKIYWITITVIQEICETEVRMKVATQESELTQVTRVRQQQKAKFYFKCTGLLPINPMSYL